jgi:hypothetical protein
MLNVANLNLNHEKGHSLLNKENCLHNVHLALFCIIQILISTDVYS